MSDAAATRIFYEVEVGPTGLVERDGRQRIAFVPRAEIESVALAHGFVAERQLAQLAMAVVLATIGGWLQLPMWLELFVAGRYGGSRLTWVGLFMATFAVAIVVGALKRGPYLRVTTRTGVRKLPFRRARGLDGEQAHRFVDDVRRRLGVS